MISQTHKRCRIYRLEAVIKFAKMNENGSYILMETSDSIAITDQIYSDADSVFTNLLLKYPIYQIKNCFYF